MSDRTQQHEFKREFTSILESRLREPHPLIQVVIGPRQVGKTTGVRQIQETGAPIHYASADLTLGENLAWIDQQWNTALQLAKPSAVLILDEIQNIDQWSTRVKALWDQEATGKKRIKLILLGSSSLSLTIGLGDSLAGRFELIEVPHWDYWESHQALGLNLDQYLELGGYPAAAQFQSEPERWQSYLRSSLLEPVLSKDILRHAQVRKPALFRQTFELLAAHPAHQITYTKLLGQLQEGGNVEIIKYYISLFEAAYLFRALPRYSGSEIRQRVSSPKILPLCPALHSQAKPDRGHAFEAAVGARLARLSGELTYWRDSKGNEIDFVYLAREGMYAIEVKSGRKRTAKGVAAFRAIYPSALFCVVGPEDFLEYSRDPRAWFKDRAL